MSESVEREIRTLRAHFWSERDPDGRAFAPLADAYLRKGDLDEAGELLDDGLGRHPEFASGHLVAARVHRARGDEEAALRSVERLLELDGGNASAHRLQGELLEAAGDPAGAAEAFELALGLDRDFEDLGGRIARLRAGAGGASAVGDPQPVSRDPTSPHDDPGFVLDEPSPSQDDPSWPSDDAPSPRDDAPSPDDGAPVVEADLEVPEGEGFPEIETAEKLLFDDVGSGFGEHDVAREPEEVDLPDEDPESSDEFLDFDFSVDEVPEDDLAVGRVPDPNYALPGPGRGGAPEAVEWPEVPEAEASDPDEEPLPPPAEDFPTYTRTLAELYVRQGLTVRAIGVYERLLQRDPGNEELGRRLDEIRAQLGRGGPEATPGAPGGEGVGPAGIDADEDDAEGFAPQWARGDVVGGDAPVTTPFAWVPEGGQGEDAAGAEDLPGRTIHAYFEDLLAWVPGAVPIESLAPDSHPEAPASRSPSDASAPTDPADPPPEGPSDGASGPSAGEGGLADLQDWLRDLER